jgi:DNA polymerase I-like protein with 3'-5' exonuclease and polymerase domains
MWGKRDFSGQELRLFAHAEEGPVAHGFLTDPDYDIHELVRAEAERLLIAAGLRDSFDRDTAKGAVFGRLYGQGVSGLMELLQLEEDEKPIAQLVQKAINTALPSIREIDNQMKALTKEDQPIKTWGGRLYYVEPPQYSARFGKNMDFAYKMLNYYCQGSGADVTKETLIRFDAHPKRKGRFTNTVYDEISFSTHAKAMKEDQKILKECMLSIETDVPMLSDGEAGENWGSLKKWKD